MSETQATVTFKGGAVGSGGVVFVIARFDDAPDEELTRQYYFDRRQGLWSAWDDTEAIVDSNCVVPDAPQHVWWLTEEGQVGSTLDCDNLSYERIPGSGVNFEDSKNWGYLNRLRCLHTSLYAVGNSGQVYRRVRPGQWQHLDDGLLQTPVTRERKSRDSINLNDIGGPAPDDLYACGDYGHLHHWDGRIWSRVALPDGISHLQEICVASPDLIYVCGYNGCLLRGNWHTGFADVSGVDDNAAFLSVHRFGDKLFLAAPQGLFTYDGKAIEPYETGLKPELRDAHQLDSADGVLWSFGYKDLAYFDGKKWTRVDHPDNEPIR
jgi:hypothetical protein